MRYEPHHIARIKEANPIAEVIGAEIQLKRSGKSMLGMCPWCTGNKPKLTVTPSKSIYHCFRCGAHGDVIKWIMERTALTFPEACERLMQRAGLSL